MARESPQQWFRWLSLARWWYNTTHYSMIHTILYEALYGKSPPLYVPYFPGDTTVAKLDTQLDHREQVISHLKHHIPCGQLRMK